MSRPPKGPPTRTIPPTNRRATAGSAPKGANSAISSDSPTPVAECLDLLERLMRGQLEGYRRLAQIIERQRNAIRTADGGALETTTREQDALVRMLASLDAQRVRLLDHLLQRWMPAGQAAAANPTLAHALTMAGDAVDDDRRTRMLRLADELRTVIDIAKSGSAVIRTAAESLSRHVAGIQQTVHSALSRARVYGRRGHLALGSATPAAVDLKS